MIVSLEHRFIFAAIPKTGTHAVRRALREHMGPKDMEQVGLFVQRKFPIPELARMGHGHFTLEQVRPFFSPEEFSGFLKFAFVRNPFDRFVSYCAFITRAGGEFERDPKHVMRHMLANPPQRHILFQPQHIFVTGEDGDLLADDLGRVEDMQNSYDRLAERIGIPSQPLEKVNASSRRDYREYYDPQLIGGVAKLYARDLELFGYAF
jgi:sulfotransferase famil protein